MSSLMVEVPSPTTLAGSARVAAMSLPPDDEKAQRITADVLLDDEIIASQVAHKSPQR